MPDHLAAQQANNLHKAVTLAVSARAAKRAAPVRRWQQFPDFHPEQEVAVFPVEPVVPQARAVLQPGRRWHVFANSKILTPFQGAILVVQASPRTVRKTLNSRCLPPLKPRLGVVHGQGTVDQVS
jgi:hypothetical protein